MSDQGVLYELLVRHGNWALVYINFCLIMEFLQNSTEIVYHYKHLSSKFYLQGFLKVLNPGNNKFAVFISFL